MSFEVLDPGPATTVQDLGRPGYGAYGVPEGGAMDRGLLAAANRLAGNRRQLAALEFALKGPRLRWRGRARLHCAVAADRISAVTLAPDEELGGEVLRQRAYGYIAVSGGFEVPLVMGGRGTCLPGGFGGFEGRELRQGDRLAVGESVSRPERPARRSPGPLAAPGPSMSDLDPGQAVVRILPGDRRVGNSTSFHALVDAEWRA